MAEGRVPAAARARPAFTVLLPILRPPVTLAHAARSVLRQGLGDLELVILCDGAPPETVAAGERIAAGDARVRVAAFPKGEGHGEAHRARVVAESGGRALAQIGDDDLWFPDHLATMARLLERADFATTVQIRIMPDGSARTRRFGDLADARVRAMLLAERRNFFGPTECAYRRSAYDALPDGWTPKPPDLWSDLHMWRKFLRLGGLRFVTRFTVTALKFGATEWDGLPPARLEAAIAEHAAVLADPAGAARLRRRLLGPVAAHVPATRYPGLLLRAPGDAVRLLPRKIAAVAGRRGGA